MKFSDLKASKPAVRKLAGESKRKLKCEQFKSILSDSYAGGGNSIWGVNSFKMNFII
ncbi:MAG: hypothetical protein LBP59_14055 [Planctomycetaceae bacterium]|nr:hypothetical protein [Planctomycetaceae bacterium]